VALTYHNRGLAYHHKKEYDRAISDFTELSSLAIHNIRVFGQEKAIHEALRVLRPGGRLPKK
jgi:hypothetical protein